ncbi:hypothetical protein H8N01_03985, partial [Streptomyces sp. AC536]|nr:hypothetical protein [Streptomyces buecherae]
APAARAATAATTPPADVPEPIPANATGPAVLDVDAATTEADAEAADVRRVTVTGVGARWAGVDLSPLEA